MLIYLVSAHTTPVSVKFRSSLFENIILSVVFKLNFSLCIFIFKCKSVKGRKC